VLSAKHLSTASADAAPLPFHHRVCTALPGSFAVLACCCPCAAHKHKLAPSCLLFTGCLNVDAGWFLDSGQDIHCRADCPYTHDAWPPSSHFLILPYNLGMDISLCGTVDLCLPAFLWFLSFPWMVRPFRTPVPTRAASGMVDGVRHTPHGCAGLTRAGAGSTPDTLHPLLTYLVLCICLLALITNTWFLPLCLHTTALPLWDTSCRPSARTLPPRHHLFLNSRLPRGAREQFYCATRVLSPVARTARRAALSDILRARERDDIWFWAAGDGFNRSSSLPRISLPRVGRADHCWSFL